MTLNKAFFMIERARPAEISSTVAKSMFIIKQTIN
jgi:hypothetical protein